jgi:type IV pilus assembly protein PilM
MAKLWTRAIRFFTEPIAPATAFSISRGEVCGVRFSRKEKRVKAHVIRPLPPGALEPAFDRPNIVEPETIDGALKDAVRRLGAPDGFVSLLIPEMCVKTVLLPFDDLPASPAEREAVVRWRLAKTLPLKMSDLRLSFDLVGTNGGGRAFCVLALENVLRDYEQAFAKAGLRVRDIGIPTPHLIGLVPRAEASNILVVSVEDDHATLLAVSAGNVVLFRVKSFSVESGPGERGPWSAAANEVANTLHFLEDREKTRIETVWVRSAGGSGAEAVAGLEARLGSPVRTISFAWPAVAGPREQALLAPLIGQVS